MKTITATITFNKANGKVTCTNDGEKDVWGKAIWRDENGKPYELCYARMAKVYAFLPITHIIVKG